MKMIKTILKPFLRIIACLMYIPLAILTLLFTSIFLIFLGVLALFGFIFTGDIDTYGNKLADELDKHKYIENLCWFILDEDTSLILNYNDMVFDKINEL